MNYFRDFATVLYSFTKDGQNLREATNIFTKLRIIPAILSNSLIYFKYSIKDKEKPEDLAFNIYGDANRYWIILFANGITDPQFEWPLDSYSFEQYLEKKYQTVDLALANVSGTFVTGEYLYNQDNQYVGIVEEVAIAESANTGNLTIKLTDTSYYTNTIIGGQTSSATGKITAFSQNTSGLFWSQANDKAPVYTQTIVSNSTGEEQIYTAEITTNTYNFANSNVHIRVTADTNETYNLTSGAIATVSETYSSQTYYDYEYNLNESRRSIQIPQSQYVSQIESEMQRLLNG